MRRQPKVLKSLLLLWKEIFLYLMAIDCTFLPIFLFLKNDLRNDLSTKKESEVQFTSLYVIFIMFWNFKKPVINDYSLYAYVANRINNVSVLNFILRELKVHTRLGTPRRKKYVDVTTYRERFPRVMATAKWVPSQTASTKN